MNPLMFVVITLYAFTTNALIRDNNEEECSNRRCCIMRHEYADKSSLDCSALSDVECGQNDNFCEWNCNPETPSKFTRKFRGITGRNQVEPKTVTFDNDDDIITFLSIDDCGVMYEESISKNIIETYGTHMKPPSGRRLLQSDVLGNYDSRTQITDNSNNKYPAVMLLRIYKGSLGFSFCTATMVSRRWAITSASCLWNFQYGRIWSGFHLYKNVLNVYDYHPSNMITVDYYWIAGGFINEGDVKYDIAMIRIKDDDSGLGWFGWPGTIKPFRYKSFKSVGYHSDKSFCTKWEQVGGLWGTPLSVLGGPNTMISAFADFGIQHSDGSPVFEDKGNSGSIWGVYSKCMYDNSGMKHAVATLTSTQSAAMCARIQRDEGAICT